MKKLSIKQKQLLECIEWFIKEYGYPPTQRELASILKCDKNTVFNKLLILEERGYITTVVGKPRTIKVLRGVDDIEED